LYVAGPLNRLTTFIYVPSSSDIYTKPDTLFEYIFNKNDIKISYTKTMQSIMQATQETYNHHNHSFMTLTLSNISAYTIGMLMQYKMIEILYLGYLLEVNPFDQPDVEEYKTKTRALLDI
jgi:glucose-6-phosphate isomerase